MSDKALGNEAFREKPDISQVFIRQLDRTNHAGSITYESAVQQKLNNLPMNRRQWVIDQSDKYEEERLTLVYKTYCGIRLGEGIPMRHDETIPFIGEEGEIDLDDPNIISPKLKLIPHIDYHKLDAIIMQAAEFAGLTWSIDPLEQDAGDTEEYIIERKRTPFRKPRIPDTEG